MVVGVRCRGVGALMGEAPRLVGPSGGWGPRGVGPGRAVVVLTSWETTPRAGCGQSSEG